MRRGRTPQNYPSLLENVPTATSQSTTPAARRTPLPQLTKHAISDPRDGSMGLASATTRTSPSLAISTESLVQKSSPNRIQGDPERLEGFEKDNHLRHTTPAYPKLLKRGTSTDSNGASSRESQRSTESGSQSLRNIIKKTTHKLVRGNYRSWYSDWSDQTPLVSRTRNSIDSTNSNLAFGGSVDGSEFSSASSHFSIEKGGNQESESKNWGKTIQVNGGVSSRPRSESQSSLIRKIPERKAIRRLSINSENSTNSNLAFGESSDGSEPGLSTSNPTSISRGEYVEKDKYNEGKDFWTKNKPQYRRRFQLWTHRTQKLRWGHNIESNYGRESVHSEIGNRRRLRRKNSSDSNLIFGFGDSTRSSSVSGEYETDTSEMGDSEHNSTGPRRSKGSRPKALIITNSTNADAAVSKNDAIIASNVDKRADGTRQELRGDNKGSKKQERPRTTRGDQQPWDKIEERQQRTWHHERTAQLIPIEAASAGAKETHQRIAKETQAEFEIRTGSQRQVTEGAGVTRIRKTENWEEQPQQLAEKNKARNEAKEGTKQDRQNRLHILGGGKARK
ncbi:hypothetical protein TWF694_002036 [Orbilia ellipsospora]|uniref:Uncharacterized protein n=1 Tax=Orbilia ellipsospora TaxID=2528407 RepID=A0AAV9X6Y6_9PEZI